MYLCQFFTSIATEFVSNMNHMILGDQSLDCFKEVLPLDNFDSFLCGSVSDKPAFCLGEKQGILENDECSSRYNRLHDFLVSVWDRRKQLLHINGSACTTQQNNPTPKCAVNGTECYDGCV